MNIQWYALGNHYWIAYIMIEMDVIDPKIANVSCWTKKSIWMILRIFWPLQKKKCGWAISSDGFVTVFGEEIELIKGYRVTLTNKELLEHF